MILLVETYCTLCDCREVWEVAFTGTGTTLTATQTARGRGSFVCDHWGDHHEAAHRAIASTKKLRESTVPPVDAVVLTDRLPPPHGRSPA